MGNLCAAVPTVTKVAVLGATGQQGGAVAAALAQKGIAVVAITRNQFGFWDI